VLQLLPQVDAPAEHRAHVKGLDTPLRLVVQRIAPD